MKLVDTVCIHVVASRVHVSHDPNPKQIVLMDYAHAADFCRACEIGLL
jgi:hypothetical protein